VLSVTAADAAGRLLARSRRDGHRARREQCADRSRLLENGRAIQVARLPGRGEHAGASCLSRVTSARAWPRSTPSTRPSCLVSLFENKRAACWCRGPRWPRRILLVEGAPGFEHSFSSVPGLATRDWRGRRRPKRQDERSANTFYVQAARSRATRWSLAIRRQSKRGSGRCDRARQCRCRDAHQRPRPRRRARSHFRRGGGLLVLRCVLRAEDCSGRPSKTRCRSSEWPRRSVRCHSVTVGNQPRRSRPKARRIPISADS
jgi:hypothetical protein